MSEEQRSGRLDMPLIVMEEDIKLHLNSAQASLDTMQVKYARNGLLSAAIVQAYSKLALTYAQFVDAKERQRFKDYMEMAVRLINAYWQDFGLTLLKTAHTEMPVAARVEPKAEPTRPPLVSAKNVRRRQVTPPTPIDPATRSEILDMLHSDEIDRYETKQEFFRAVAKAYGHPNWKSISQMYYKEVRKPNGH